MSHPLRLSVHFTDGSKLDCQFERQTDDSMQALKNIRRAMEADKLVAEIEGQLFLIPMANVKYIRLVPAPDNLPEGVIRGARLVD